jgi:hypothetical protein
MPMNRMPPLYEGAATLLPGLQHARSLIDTAILICEHYAKQSPKSTDALNGPSESERLGESVQKTRDLLAAFNRSRTRRR